MTGYGTATESTKQLDICAEFRSINSKYLEVSIRCPGVLSEKEAELKDLISKKISRGKISLLLSVVPKKDEDVFVVDLNAIKHHAEILRRISQTAGIDEPIRLEHILKFPEIFKNDDNKILLNYWGQIRKVVIKAYDDMLKMKLREGEILGRDILKRIKSISSRVKKITILSKRNLAESKRKLEAKVNQLISEFKINTDPNRLEYELLMLSDRLDITEEIIRTESHLDYFLKELSGNTVSGRRLNFLVQEINREVNTIASKASNSDISQIVVEIKEELEKIKEQLQNVE